MKAQTTSLEAHVPRVATSWERESPGSLWRTIDGTLLFVDISGFTNLSERLARKGRVGAEELTSVLNRVFGEMLHVVFERGGSLLKFGGDALLLLFATEDHVMQACAAAVEMRSVLREASKERTSVGRIDLKMSSGIHSGPAHFFLVGDSHRELIVTGPTASVTTEMEATADASEIVVSAETVRLLPSGFTGDAKGKGLLLRKRKIDHPRCGRLTQETLPETELSTFIPRALREHLASGVTESEHRLATIGFVKFKGVDGMLAGRGPERVAEELDRLIRAVQEAVDGEGVTFLASDIDADGGKIILTAGVPIGRHDDEGRMLRAARRILDGDAALKVRIGVNRGHVFSGNVGTEYRRTYTVMGDTVNLAARLMAAADPGMLYASPSPLDLSSTLFRTKAIEPFHVKGKENPVQAYAVFEEIGVRPPELKHELPFHGRDAELEMIVDIVTTCATSGRGGMMTITGDTGVGKSRLVAEVLERCPGLATLMIQAEPNGKDNPYWAFRDPLRRLFGVERASQSKMEATLSAALDESAPGSGWALPLLGDVMHIEIDDNEETSAIDPKFRPDRTADALIEILEQMHLGPFATLAEDGHWMDDASLQLLKRIGGAARTRPWTVVITARCDDSDFEPLGDEVALRPLGDDSVRAIAIEATAGAPLRPHELDAIVSRAGGNPLFLSEILNVIRETGSADRLPDSLDAVVSTEIDTLPPLARQLLRYSSVLGRSFAKVVLNEFLAVDDIHLDEATRQELGRFLEDDGEERLRFRHSVVQNVAYEGLPYRRRRELHARAGGVVERLAGENPDAASEFLSTHYSLSGEYEKAWRFSRVAADRAKRAYANTEAATHYRRAIEAAKRRESVEPRELADIWTRLGEVQDLAGEYEAAREAFSRALKANGSDPARAAGLYLRRAEAWFGSGNLSQAKRNITLGRKQIDREDEASCLKVLARLDAYEASVHAAGGDPVQALASASSALERARSTDEGEALARALGVIDWANFMMGRDEPRHGEQAIEILQELGYVERSVAIMNNMGAYAYLEGNWDEAIDWYRQSIEAAERSGNVYHAANSRMNLGELLVGQRRYEEATSLLNDAERVFRASNAPQALPFVSVYRARAALGLGRVDQAIEDLERVVSRQLDTGKSSEIPEAVIYLAEALARSDRSSEALDWLDRLESQAPEVALELSPGLGRVRGLVLASINRHREAIDALEQSIEAAVNDGDQYAEALTREARIETQIRVGQDPDPADIARVTDLFNQLGIRSHDLDIGIGEDDLRIFFEQGDNRRTSDDLSIDFATGEV